VKIAVVEILDRDGTARRVVPITQWPATIGRAVDCDVVVDDPHVAAQHVTIDEADGVLSIRVGDSVNGVTWPGTHLKAGADA
jgi:pSer/pThr/pTyr-binding forkhead associated (FHA) protein